MRGGRFSCTSESPHEVNGAGMTGRERRKQIFDPFDFDCVVVLSNGERCGETGYSMKGNTIMCHHHHDLYRKDWKRRDDGRQKER